MEREGVAGAQPTAAGAGDDSDSDGPSDLLRPSALPPLVRVVSVESADYAQAGTSFLPVPARGSIRIILEFSFREDLLLSPLDSKNDTAIPGVTLSFGLSYLSGDSTRSLSDNILYYRK